MSQQKSPYEELILFLIVVFLIGGIAWAVWYAFDTEIKSFVRWVRVAEMHVASLVAGDDYSIMHPQIGEQKLGTWKEGLPKADARNLTVDSLSVATSLAMQPLRMVFVGILGAMAMWAIFFGPGNSYRRKMGLEELIAEHSKSFPTITPFIEFNPNKIKARAPGDAVPKKLPIFAEALAPEEWVAYHNIPFQDGKLDYDKAYRALAKQLGPRWQGPEKLPIHARGLYAAFALKSVRKRKESDKLIEEMALCWSEKGGFKPTINLRSNINKVIKDQKICGELNKVTKRHAYQTTALLRALQRSREEGGVLASATFVWLRSHDRTLWYPLNNLGRKSYHAEAGGAMAHFTNELVADQRIPSPRFEEVIKVIEEVLTGPDARPVPKRA